MRSHYRYIAIDLKSFYASVECQARGFDPLTTNLVVADASRTEKTICLAVSPSLKAYGIGGRARLFEVVQRVREVNADRLGALRRLSRHGAAGASVDLASPGVGGTVPCSSAETVVDGALRGAPVPGDCTGRDLKAYRPFEGTLFSGGSFRDPVVRANPDCELDFLIAKPRMATYLEYSTRIYQVYLRHFAPEDIHVYSIDEVLIDAGGYLTASGKSIRELASQVVSDVYAETGITATAGIGTNLYLAKVAMDILAKHEEPDENGVRIAELDEDGYKRRLWSHEPLTDFWRVGPGYARKLHAHGMRTMGDVARCSLGGRSERLNEDLLFKLFGKNAELLIDHAWGVEPVGMADIKGYRPRSACKVSGQVLQRPYTAREARLVAWEMADQLALDLLSEGLVTDKITLTVGYDRVDGDDSYEGQMVVDRYGRSIPKHAHGTANLDQATSSSALIAAAVTELFDQLVDGSLQVHRINVGADQLVTEQEAAFRRSHRQLRLFEDEESSEGEVEVDLARERKVQDAMLGIRGKFGKNAILRAANLQEAGTARQRNNQIGGHSA